MRLNPEPDVIGQLPRLRRYALSGQITRSDMQKLADAAYLQLTGRQPAAN
jgi:hypothetical protein